MFIVWEVLLLFNNFKLAYIWIVRSKADKE